MGISEFTVHNVLRTYSRQDRLGKVQKARAKPQAPPPSSDRVSLSATGQKVQWLGQLAAEVVDRQEPGLAPDQRAVRARQKQDELVERHGPEVRDDKVSAQALEARLRPVYLD